MRWPLSRREPKLLAEPGGTDGAPLATGAELIERFEERFALGLKWVPAAAPASAKDEAKRTAAAEKARLYTLRTDPKAMPQYAVSAGGQDAQPGMIAAAAVIASHIGGTFLAALPLPDGRYWIIALDGGVLREPEPDIVLADEGTARRYLAERLDRLRSDFSADDTAVYAPVDWHDDYAGMGLTAFEPPDVWAILDSAKGPRLLPTTRSKLPVAIGLAIVAAVAAAGGFTYYSLKEAEAERQAAAQRGVERQARAEVEKSFSPPWAKRPSPKTVLAACYGAFGQLYTNVEGWRARQLRCIGGTTVEIEWLQLRRSAPLATVRTAMAAAAPAAVPVGLTPSGNSITYQMGLALPDAELATEPTLAPLDAQQAMLAVTQNVNIGLTIESRKEEQPPVPPAAKRLASPPKVPTFRWTEWTTVSSTDPRLLPLADMPGVIVNNVILAPERVEWTIKGAIYDPR